MNIKKLVIQNKGKLIAATCTILGGLVIFAINRNSKNIAEATNLLDTDDKPYNTLNIILGHSNKNINNIRDEIHQTLAGNKDYVDSNIVLSDVTNGCELFFSGDECEDKEYIRMKAKEAIDLFIDSRV